MITQDILSAFNSKKGSQMLFLNSRYIKYSTVIRRCPSWSRLIVVSEVRGEMYNLYLVSRRSRLPTINVTAETSDSVCTPHHLGRAFDDYPLPREDPIDPYLATPWHPSLDPPTPALADIFNAFFRHPRRPSHPSSQPVRRDSLLTRPPLGCLIFRLSRFSSPTAQRQITDRQNYTTKTDLLLQGLTRKDLNSTF